MRMKFIVVFDVRGAIERVLVRNSSCLKMGALLPTISHLQHDPFYQVLA